MKRLFVACVLAILLSGCGGGNQDTFVRSNEAPPADLNLPKTYKVNAFVERPADPSDADLAAEHFYKDEISVSFRFGTLEEIQEAAKVTGYSNWESIYGLSWAYGNQCDVLVEEPDSYWDVMRLYVIGHEMLHCWGWGSHR